MSSLLRTSAALAVAGLALAGCGNSSDKTSDAAGPALTIVDGWCKSTDTMPDGFKDMTGCFGTVKNTGSADITITGGSSAAAQMVQTHETVMGADGKMQMQEAKKGFTVKAGGTFELKPGANHVMLMMISKPLQIGDAIPVTLKTSTGEVPVSFQARAFDAANETYVPVK